MKTVGAVEWVISRAEIILKSRDIKKRMWHECGGKEILSFKADGD